MYRWVDRYRDILIDVVAFIDTNTDLILDS